MSYRYPAKVTVPPGLRTLLEGFSRAVVKRQPEAIAKFATFYFAELLCFRKENPSLGINDLIREFNATKVDKFPTHGIGAVIAPLAQLAFQNNGVSTISSGSPEVQPGVYHSAWNHQTFPNIPGVEDQDAGKPSVQSQDILYTVTMLPGQSPGPNTAADVSFVASQYLSDFDLQSLLEAATSDASLHPISAEQSEEVVVYRRKTSTGCMAAACGMDSDAPDLCQHTGSTFFERVPLNEIDLQANTVLIRTPSVPCEYMIVVQSENVPETIVFQTDASVGEKESAEREATDGGGGGGAAAAGLTGPQSNTRLDLTSRLTLPAPPSQVFKDQSPPKLVTPLVLAEDPELIGRSGRAVDEVEPGCASPPSAESTVDPHLDLDRNALDTNGCNPYINEMMQDIMNEMNLSMPEELKATDFMGPNNLAPLETDYESMVKPQVFTSHDIQTPGSVYSPVTSPQETTATGLVYPPVSSPQETTATGLVYPPISSLQERPVSKAEDVSAPGLVCPLISEEISTPEEKITFKFMDPFLSMAKKIFSLNSANPPVLESSDVLTGEDKTTSPSSVCSFVNSPLSEETREDSLPYPSIPSPQETMALLFPPILAQKKMRPLLTPFTQVPAAHLPQGAGPVASQNEASYPHVNEEEREPSMAPQTCPHHMGVPQTYVRPQHPQFIHSCSTEAISQRPCDAAPTVAMPECQTVRPAVCGSSWRQCHLARPESMARMPTAVACQGGSRTELCCGAGHVCNPEQANTPTYSSHYLPLGGADGSFQILCPLSGAAYIPATTSDHHCCCQAPKVIPPHYVRIQNGGYHERQGAASFSCPAPSPVHPQGCGCAPVHMCTSHSGTGHSVSSTCHHVRDHAGFQQGAAQHYRQS